MTQTPLLRQQKSRTSETGSLRRWLEAPPSSCPPAALDPEPLPCPAPRVPPGLKQPPSRRVVSKTAGGAALGQGPAPALHKLCPAWPDASAVLLGKGPPRIGRLTWERGPKWLRLRPQMPSCLERPQDQQAEREAGDHGAFPGIPAKRVGRQRERADSALQAWYSYQEK